MGGGSAVDAPFGREHGLLAVHPQVARLLRLAHEVTDGLVAGQLEVEVDLHTTTMGVGGHGVPHTAHGQLCHPHLQLTGGQHLVHQHLVDVALVRHFQTAHVGHHGILLRHLPAGIGRVGGARIEIELGGVAGIERGKAHLAVATSNVERLFVVQLKHLVAYAHATFSAHIVDAHLAACSEKGSLQRVDGLQGQHLVHRHGASYNHTVVHRVNHLYLVGHKQPFNQEVATQPMRVVVACILGVCGIAQFIVRFHLR